MRSWGETSSILCFHAAGRTHSNRVSAPHSAHTPMAHLHCLIQRGLSRSCGLPAALQDSFLGELKEISRGVDPDGFPPESQCDHCRRAAPDKRIEHGSASRACRAHWLFNECFGKHGILMLRKAGVLEWNDPDIRRHPAPRSFQDAILPQNRRRRGTSDRIHVVVCVFTFHKVKELLVGRSEFVLGRFREVRRLVPDHLASDFPSDFSHRECDAPRDSQPFLPFALVIEIEPVASRGPCDTVHLSPDGHEGFNVFLHGPFASDFVDSVADVPTSAVVRRARDGAIHGSISQGPEYFSGVSKQEPTFPAGEDGRYHVRSNPGQTHIPFLQPARRAFSHARTLFLTSPSPGKASFPQPVADGTCRAADVWRAVESSSP